MSASSMLSNNSSNPWDGGYLSVSTHLPAGVFMTFFLVSLPLVLAAFLSNGLAFVVFVKKPIFRKMNSNRLVMNLMLLNVVSCLFLFPSVLLDIRLNTFKDEEVSSSAVLISLISGHEPGTEAALGVCVWSSLISSLVTNASILAMLAVGVDQYLAILNPLEYSTRVTRRVSCHMITAVWIAGAVSAALGSLQFMVAHSPWATCRAAITRSDTDIDEEGSWWWPNDQAHRAWIAAVNVAFYAVPFSVLVYIYLRIFWAARKNSLDLRRNQTSTSMSCVPGLELDGGSLDESTRKKSSPPRSLEEDSQQRRARHNDMNSLQGEDAARMRKTARQENFDVRLEAPEAPDKDPKEAILADDSAIEDPPEVPQTKSRPYTGGKALFKQQSSSPRSSSACASSTMLRARARAPKLSLLRARGGALAAEVFSKPVTSFESTTSCPPLSNSSISRGSKQPSTTMGPPSTPGVNSLNHAVLGTTQSNMSHQLQSSNNGSIGGSLTPKRKCSFSSFSECRLLEEDGGKHHTFLFSIEAPSPPPTPDLRMNDENQSQTNVAVSEDQGIVINTSCDSSDKDSCLGGSSNHLSAPAAPGVDPLKLTASQRRRRFSQVSLSLSTSTAATISPWNSKASTASGAAQHGLVAGAGSISSTSLLAQPDSQLSAALGSVDTTSVDAVNMSKAERLRKSGSLLSMTSQAARRLSCTVSRRASSVYQFFHYKEELRTAKISTLVVAVAFVCWAPYFTLALALAFPRGKVPSEYIFWLHLASTALTLVFTALTPYIYVFRSGKARACARGLLGDCARWLCRQCWRCWSKLGVLLGRGSNCSNRRDSSVKVTRNRSFSCPALPNVPHIQAQKGQPFKESQVAVPVTLSPPTPASNEPQQLVTAVTSTPNGRTPPVTTSVVPRRSGVWGPLFHHHSIDVPTARDREATPKLEEEMLILRAQAPRLRLAEVSKEESDGDPPSSCKDAMSPTHIISESSRSIQPVV